VVLSLLRQGETEHGSILNYFLQSIMWKIGCTPRFLFRVILVCILLLMLNKLPCEGTNTQIIILVGYKSSG